MSEGIRVEVSNQWYNYMDMPRTLSDINSHKSSPWAHAKTTNLVCDDMYGNKI